MSPSSASNSNRRRSSRTIARWTASSCRSSSPRARRSRATPSPSPRWSTTSRWTKSCSSSRVSRRAPLSTRHPLPAGDQQRRGQHREAHALSPLRVEGRGVEPPLERGLQRRPLTIDGRVPRRIAIAALVDERLTEYALERQSEPLSRGPRRRIQRIALPFVPPVAEGKGMLHHQEHRFAGGGRALQERREVDVADLDRPCRRRNPKVRRDPDGATVNGDGVELRIVPALDRRQPLRVFVA